MPRATLSACLIVQDEERRLPAALARLGFCDEIVVVDGGSADGTVTLAQAGGAKVIENPWPGFAAQRNVALRAASGDWVLEVDADERVTPELRESIERLLAVAPAGVDVAVFALRNRFLGRLLGPSAKYPAYRTRLWRRGAYEHDESRHVHEGVEPRARPAVLAGDLEHELADDLSEALRDAWRYARLESAQIARPSNPARYVFGMLGRPVAKLLYRLVLDGGWRDGWRGLVKISLDAGSDALVWARVLTGAGARVAVDRPGEGPGRSGARDGHFGRRPTGPPKVIAIARRGRAESAARSWLGALAACGVDAALISDGPAAGEEIPGRRVARLWPLRTMRAVDVEMQIRTAHAVVAFGRWARLIERLLPGALRPRIAGVQAGVAPSQALEALRAAVPW